MKNVTKIIGFVFTIVLYIQCSKMRSGNNKTTYLARVGASYLTLRQAMENIPRHKMQQDSALALATYRDHWIHRQILLNKAENLQLSDREKVKNKLKMVHDDVLINALEKLIIFKHNKHYSTSNTEALNYYRKNKNKLILNERYVKFRHIETPDLKNARRARDWLQKDSTWTKVAHNFSLNPQKNIKKAEKYWPVSTVFNQSAIMKRYVSQLDSGQISPIQRYEGIYHLIQLTDVRKQGETADPRWFINQLKEWLSREKQRNYYNSYVKNLYLSAKEHNEIEVYNVSTPNINDKIDSAHTHQSHE